jgi:LuxR family maltose regulon positive regulatory protein
MSATILIVDDHALFREGIRGLLQRKGFRVIGEAGDGREALEKVRELSPEVVVMDINMPNLDGIKATRGIMDASPDTKVIALSMHGGKRFVEDMLQAGAVGYILKDAAPEQLVDGVRAVLMGEIYMSPAITGLVVAQYVNLLAGTSTTVGRGNLTKEEKSYIQWVGEGCSREEIVARLASDEASVQALEQAVIEKLELAGPAELVEYAGALKWFDGQEGIDAAMQQAATSGFKRGRATKPQPLIDPLTQRELDVLKLLAGRLYDKEIAEKLSVSLPTVKTHVSHILQKLGAGNRRAAADKALALGIID